ncbi:hypothetical protein [Amycolatopsis taiwanensis]|uniref:Uncharacterized protein n=1 Tax=Amycolatopsis taiwanensis TaxID=342230 RepID=A0A9W6QTV0_9PSEU|nr:hypothetical protein [Amycolatopsis taiwanensis]GLY63648.1 hypothetical protein Atai01_02670 [Amycolatopsis taiwanensis]
MKRWVLLVVGVVLALIGVLWTLQGSNIITGSGMSGQRQWFLIGLIALVVGIGLVISQARRKTERS